MKAAVRFFLKYPFYANLLIGVIMLLGIISMLNMKTSFFPNATTRRIMVSVFYPGASPKEMEEGVTSRIEDALRGIVGIKEFSSVSRENSSSVNITTTGEYDIDETLMEVKNAVDGLSALPSAAERPIVRKVRSRSMAVNLGLRSDVSGLTLKAYANKIEEDLLMSGYISSVSIWGLPSPELVVEIDQEAMLRYKITFTQLQGAIVGNNLDMSGGEVRSDEREMLIRVRERSADPNKLGEMVLRTTPEGRVIRVKDVALVKKELRDQSSGLWINGAPGVYFDIQKLPEEDLQSITNFCSDYVEKFNEENPNAELYVAFNFFDMLVERLSLLMESGGSGLLLVLLVLTLFLNFRLAGWVAFGIPFSMCAMCIVALLAGVTINMISLFGMILVIGILVDDGIVIGENIFTHFERGKNHVQAAIDGTLEVFPAVMSSILTTVIAFTPIAIISGDMEFLNEMGFVVIAALLCSLVEAFLILPTHLGTPHVLSRKSEERKKKRLFNVLNNFIFYVRDNFYAPVASFLVHFRHATIFIPLALIIVTVGMLFGGTIKSTFFPYIPYDAFSVNLAFSPGTGQSKTLSYLGRFDSLIWVVNNELSEEYPDRLPYITFTTVSLGDAFGGKEVGGHAGNIYISLRNMEGDPIVSTEIAERVRQKIGSIPEAEKYSVGGGNRWGSPVSVSLRGQNKEVLDRATRKLLKELNQYPELTNVVQTDPQGKDEIVLKIKPFAYSLGFNYALLAGQVQSAFFGKSVQRLQEGRDELRIWLKYSKKDRLHQGQLEEMRVQGPNGGEYPLKELVDFTIQRGPVVISHFNAQREIRVEADMKNPNEPVPPTLEKIRTTLFPELLSDYPSISASFMGQARRSEENSANIQASFPLAILFIIIVLMIHFRSIPQAFIILIIIPISFIGAMWGHGLHGKPISILSVWGMVALMGVIINDSVVFLDRFNQLLKRGLPVENAVLQAGKDRFRAIVLTSLTTVAGMYPLILQKSFQAQFLIPMAISLAFGVLVGTFFILTFLPPLIMVINDVRYLWSWLWHGIRPASREVLEPAIIQHRHAQEESHFLEDKANLVTEKSQ